MFDNRIMPVEAHGIKVMSIGLLVNDKEPLVWRGPMIHSFIQQMLKDVMWGALDYLVFDMPPGTGDAQLSLSQVVPLAASSWSRRRRTWRSWTCARPSACSSDSTCRSWAWSRT